MKKFFLVLSIATLLLSSAHAERIDGTAKVREKPNGKVLFTLENDVKVETSQYRLDGSWYRIGLFVWFGEKHIIDESGISMINKGATLYDWRGRVIGKTMSVINPSIYEIEKDGKRYATYIDGYTYKTNIQDKDIVEKDLEKLLNSKIGPLELSEMKSHISRYNYQQWFRKGGMDSYLSYESIIDDISPGPRVILVFYDGVLAGLIYSRDIRLGSFKPKDILRGIEWYTLKNWTAKGQRKSRITISASSLTPTESTMQAAGKSPVLRTAATSSSSASCRV